MVQLIFSQDPQTAGKSCNYPQNKTSPAAESGKFSWLQSSRAESTRGMGADPHCSSCSPELPSVLCQPHAQLSLDPAPPQRQHQVFQLCPHQTGNAEGFTLLQELSSPRDTQLILRPSTQARARTASQSSQIHEQTKGISTWTWIPAVPSSATHLSPLFPLVQPSPGSSRHPTHTCHSCGSCYEFMFQSCSEESWPRHFAAAQGLNIPQIWHNCWHRCEPQPPSSCGTEGVSEQGSALPARPHG